MIRSMTAFATAEHSGDAISAEVEIRSYNSRYLDTVLRISRQYGPLEEKIKAVISSAIARGRVEVNVQISHAGNSADNWVIDASRADAYYGALNTLQERYGLKGAVPVELLVRAEGVVKAETPSLDLDDLWAVVAPAVHQAVDQLIAMREQEGIALAEDLQARVDQIASLVNRIEDQSQEMIPLYQERLTRRMEQLTRGKIEVDPVRIAQEVAFLADRSDISEELVRCASHLDQFRGIMAAPDPAGRKLNFLLQELNRELNTIGAKAEKARIAHWVVDAKAELEKIREQVQNVE